MNLCHHTILWTLELKLNGIFFVSSHDKGPCDGVGGLLKRMATKASLQRLYQDQIQTSHQLYEFAKQNVPSLNVDYFTVGYKCLSLYTITHDGALNILFYNS